MTDVSEINTIPLSNGLQIEALKSEAFEYQIFLEIISDIPIRLCKGILQTRIYSNPLGKVRNTNFNSSLNITVINLEEDMTDEFFNLLPVGEKRLVWAEQEQLFFIADANNNGALISLVNNKSSISINGRITKDIKGYNLCYADNYQYTGNASLLDIGVLGSTTNLSVNNLSVKISAITDEIISYLLTTIKPKDYVGLYLLTKEENENWSAPYQLYKGYFGASTINETLATVSISKRMANWRLVEPLRYNAESAHFVDPTDAGFRFVKSTSEIVEIPFP